MFKEIGMKIKNLAEGLFWIGTIMAGLFGLVFIEDTEGLSLLYAIIAVIVFWISSWFLYGFGEMIDKLCDIERNTRGYIPYSEKTGGKLTNQAIANFVNNRPPVTPAQKDEEPAEPAKEEATADRIIGNMIRCGNCGKEQLATRKACWNCGKEFC